VCKDETLETVAETVAETVVLLSSINPSGHSMDN